MVNRSFLPSFFEHKLNKRKAFSYKAALRTAKVATFIPNLDPEAVRYLNKITIQIKPFNELENYYIRIHLYEKEKNISFPSKELEIQNNIFEIQKMKNNIELDVSDWLIKLPKSGIFIAIEYLGKNSGGLTYENVRFPEILFTPVKEPTTYIFDDRIKNWKINPYDEILKQMNGKKSSYSPSMQVEFKN